MPAVNSRRRAALVALVGIALVVITGTGAWIITWPPAVSRRVTRLSGGIHLQANDFTGRMVRSECGEAAWARAQLYFVGQVGT